VDSRALTSCAHQRDTVKIPTNCVKQRRLSHHVCFGDIRFDGYAIARNKYHQKSHKAVIFDVSVQGVLIIQSIAMDACMFVQLANVISHANFSGCILRNLVSAKGRY
jgi:hypothetical protein